MTYPTLTPLFYSVNNIDINKADDSVKRTANQTLYESFIASAIAAVSDYCQQPLLSATREVWFDSFTREKFTAYNGLEKILPFTFTVSTSSTMQTRQILSDDWTTVSSSNYRIEQRDKNWYLAYWNFTNGYQYKLNAVVGYAESAIPKPLQTIVIDIASWMLKESNFGKGLLGIHTHGVSGGVGSTTTQYENMPERFKKALAPYRIPS